MAKQVDDARVHQMSLMTAAPCALAAAGFDFSITSIGAGVGLVAGYAVMKMLVWKLINHGRNRVDANVAQLLCEADSFLELSLLLSDQSRTTDFIIEIALRVLVVLNVILFEVL